MFTAMGFRAVQSLVYWYHCEYSASVLGSMPLPDGRKARPYWV
jgi:hypothetical protein